MRGLILGGLAFAAVFSAERQFGAFGKDIKRYNMMRAMSGDPPLSRQAVGLIGVALKGLSKARRPQVMEVVTALQTDLVRYLRISSM